MPSKQLTQQCSSSARNSPVLCTNMVASSRPKCKRLLYLASSVQHSNFLTSECPYTFKNASVLWPFFFLFRNKQFDLASFVSYYKLLPLCCWAVGAHCVFQQAVWLKRLDVGAHVSNFSASPWLSVHSAQIIKQGIGG